MSTDYVYRMHVRRAPERDAIEVFALRYDLDARRQWHMTDNDWVEHTEGGLIAPAVTVTGQMLRAAAGYERSSSSIEATLDDLKACLELQDRPFLEAERQA